jgi:hypothetical protein
MLRNAFKKYPDLVLNFTTEAQSSERLPLEMFLCDLCASVVRNLHDQAGKRFRHAHYQHEQSSSPRIAHIPGSLHRVGTFPRESRSGRLTGSPLGGHSGRR